VEIPRSSGLVREGLWVSALTVASKLLGIVREGLMAWAFGTSGLVDAFRVAQSGTFLLMHMLGGSVLESAFLPTFKHLLSTGRRRLAWRTVQQARRALWIAGGVLFLVLLFAGGLWTRILAPGFDPGRARLTAIFFAAMALTVPLALHVNLMTTVSTALYRFRIPALRALVQNLAVLAGIVIALLLGARSRPSAALAPLGASLPVAQAVMLVLLVIALREVARPKARGTTERDRLIWRFFGLTLLPGLALVFLEQANLIVERMVASRLSEGSIASLDYARFLVETPLVTIGVGITQTLLPTLSDLSATGDRARFTHSVRTLLLACLWALLPISVWLLSFGEELIRVVYARGAFGEASVQTTTAALSGFAIGLWAWFGGTILQRAYYARRNLRVLLPLTSLGLVSFAVLSFLWAPRMGVRGVSTAFSVANVLFFSGSLAFLGWGLARTVLPVLAYLLAGGGLFYLVGPGIVPQGTPIVRLTLGAVLILLAWVGWTAMNPATRRLALGLIRVLRRKG
jgi:putative peptidoglycan lipid II flippase